MIIKEFFTIDDKNFVKFYSDGNFYILAPKNFRKSDSPLFKYVDAVTFEEFKDDPRVVETDEEIIDTPEIL